MQFWIRDFPPDLRKELNSCLFSILPIAHGLAWSFVFPFRDGAGRLINGYWFGFRRDTLSGPVLTIRSTFWCFGFDKNTPLSFRARKVDNTEIVTHNGFQHTVRLRSTTRFGFSWDDITTVIREEIPYDWS
jgi:hypothetical protein